MNTQKPPLTDRQLQILRLLAEGYSIAEIAKALFLEPGTVSTHVQNIRSKLGLKKSDLPKYYFTGRVERIPIEKLISGDAKNIEEARAALRSVRQYQQDWQGRGVDRVHQQFDSVEGDWLENFGETPAEAATP